MLEYFPARLFICTFNSSWLFPYFVKGYKRELTEDDMYRHRKIHDSKMLGDRLEAAWSHETSNRVEPSLNKALLKVFGLEIFYISCIPLVGEACR